MEPNDIPVIAGASGAGEGNGPSPAPLQDIRSALSSAEFEARLGLDELADAIRAELQRSEDSAIEGIATLGMAISEELDKAWRKTVKGVETVVGAIRDEMAEVENRMHKSIADVGGTPIIMSEEAYAINQAGDPWAETMSRIIMPAIDQQTREVQAGRDPYEVANETMPGFAALDAPAVPPVAPPPGYVPPGAGNYVPGVPAPPLPFPPALPIPIPGVNDGPPIPPGGGDDPDKPDDHEYPEPSPGADDNGCCPPTTIVVPAPVVHVHLPGGGSYPAPTVPEVPPVPPPPGTYPPPGGEPGVPPPPVPPGVPPAPPAVPPVIPPGSTVGPVDPVGTYDGPEACRLLKNAATVVQGGFGEFYQGTGRPFFEGIANGARQIPIVGPMIAAGIMGGADITDSVWSAVGTRLAQIGLPNLQAAFGDIGITFAAGALDKWAGTDIGYYMQPVEQAARFANPLNMVAQSDVDRMFMSNRITIDTWTCLTRSNGNMPWQHEQAMLSGQQKLSLGDLISLTRRGLLSVDAYAIEARELGYLDGRYPQLAYALSENVPTMSDVFTWMVKDVANEEYVRIAKLDEGFADSWSPDFQRWAVANGASPQQIAYQYRSQWADIPPTHIFEYMRRLRPGRVDPKIAFTHDDAKLLLKIQEVPAGFRDREIAISYLPVNRTDLIEAYKAGTVDRPELRERLQDIGYSPDDSSFLTKMIVAKAQGQQQSAAGTWTKRRIGKEYKEGSIDKDQAFALLSRTVLDPREVTQILDDTDMIRSAEARSKCVKGIKRRFYTGELDPQQARAELIALGVGQEPTATLLTGWKCERSSRSKEPTVKMLTEWVESGIITVVDYGARLLNLGYTKADADRIIAAAGIAFQKKGAAKKK